MAYSEHLKDLKAVWGDSCHAMWAELLCIAMAESHVVSNYKDIPASKSIDEMFYAPELRGRINALTRDTFLERTPSYRHAVVTNRIVILSASFEAYFSSFLDAYIQSRAKLFDAAIGSRTPAGDKLYGEVRKVRGLVQRIQAFSEHTGSGIKKIEPYLSYLGDVYTLRNVLAHRAGLVDDHASRELVNVRIASGEKVILSPAVLIDLAAPVMSIADLLDRKIVSEYDPSTGRHRPEHIAETGRRRPPKIRPSRKAKS
ncbi:hypothetical protein CFHF_04240 [Caulobacter flavus]|uniref:RiboL-PSP-HEPN domain-containing protein n=1 Tax=Caulobacter flavus TaxID=1679497 RepID=A0A2N5CZI7_9CAUL|nr:hypothetical protein [Caulobacter flavus]AYV45100.1 hypothetical protein C1707_01930 [Caulobacter flavus]PLR19220.1 hypothetical protein CFHF_04240 [Caulobacter flavus]